MIQRYAQFYLFRKVSGLVYQLHFEHDFSRKRFFMLHSINWPTFIVWLPLFLEILGNMYMTIVCFPGCDFVKFEINLIIFPIKPFCYMTKKSRQKLKYLEKKELLTWNKKHFASVIKGFQLPKMISDLKVRLWVLTCIHYYFMERCSFLY